MSQRLFRFKQFAVAHEASAMKVGTDGVTLGALAPAGGRVLDVGCGCGLIGLMLAQRGAAEITMIEIDPAAAAEAAANAAASPWADRVNVITADFLGFSSGGKTFDSIVSNPPFFAETLTSPDARRAAARSEAALPPDAFMRQAATMLAQSGTISVIVPAERREAWTFAARCAGLHPTHTVMIATKPGAQPKRCVCGFSNEPGNTGTSRLDLNSDSYKHLTSEFYLDKL